MNRFDSIVTGCLDIAQSEAMQRKHANLHAEHLLLGMILNPQTHSSKSIKSLKKDVEQLLTSLPTVSHSISADNLRPDAKLSEWLTFASSYAVQNGANEVCEKDLIRFLPKIFPNLNIDFSKIDETEEELPSFLINLNQLAIEGKLDPVIGRTKEIRAVMEILGRRGKNNPVLVGSAGVGKTAIVEGLADAIVKGNVPDVLRDKEVFSLDMGALMAGTKFRGEFEERLQKMIKTFKDKAGSAILFIDEIHQLVGAGKTDGAMDAANLLKPALARGELHCIGATTSDEYQKYILGDSALDRRFRSVPINEPNKEDAIEILMGIREKLEAHHGIKISDEAIYSSVMLSDQYIRNKNLPDKAIDLVDEAASALKLSAEAMPSKLAELEAEIRSKKIFSQMDKDNESLKNEIDSLESLFNTQKKDWENEVLSMKKTSELKGNLDRFRFELEQAQRNADFEAASKLKYSLIPDLEKQLEEIANDWTLDEKNIALIIHRQTGIPVEKILKDKQENILTVESVLNENVFGQNEAIKELSETLITAFAGLKDETRPLGSFLLRGPSGVGKTETAKALSRFLFDTEDNIIRIDLSEFSEKHSVAKLIGAPAGYVGYEEGGVLTEAVRRKPFSIILFDEVEKAHKDFSDILLQILDDGRLTDNKGRVIDFKNTIIFMTTNSRDLEVDFKPEVLGRIDSVLNYKHLDKSIMVELFDKELSLLKKRMSSKKVDIKISDNLKSIVCERGYDENYGARPLASVFNKLIIRPLAHQILKGEENTRIYHLDWDKNLQVVSLS